MKRLALRMGTQSRLPPGPRELATRRLLARNDRPRDREADPLIDITSAAAGVTGDGATVPIAEIGLEGITGETTSTRVAAKGHDIHVHALDHLQKIPQPKKRTS